MNPITVSARHLSLPLAAFAVRVHPVHSDPRVIRVAAADEAGALTVAEYHFGHSQPTHVLYPADWPAQPASNALLCELAVA
jgi:hypothetical protein